MRNIVSGVLIATAMVVASPMPAFAAEPGASPQGHADAMPAREAAFIAIFTDERARYATMRLPAQRAGEQIVLEHRLSQFMQGGQDVRDWVGVIRNFGKTLEGDAWLTIEIAPDLMLSTLRSAPQDRGYQTLIPSYSPTFATLGRELPVGQRVRFDASMLIFDVSDKVDPVERSRLIARFWKLQAIP